MRGGLAWTEAVNAGSVYSLLDSDPGCGARSCCDLFVFNLDNRITNRLCLEKYEEDHGSSRCDALGRGISVW